MKLDVQPIKRRRTDEERKRRHLYGDKGATFSKAKEIYLGGGRGYEYNNYCHK